MHIIVSVGFSLPQLVCVRFAVGSQVFELWSWSCRSEVCANTSVGFRYSFVSLYEIMSLVKRMKMNILSFCISTLTLICNLHLKPHIQSPGKTNLGRVADRPEGCADIQRDLDRLKKWANRTLVQLNKWKCKVLSLGRNNPRHHYKLRAAQLKSSCAEEALGCPDGHQVECEPAMCPHGKDDSWHPELH